jgi:nucleoside-diphosphate-sugar epimerase
MESEIKDLEMRKVVAITGGSQGIGRSLVEEFASQGYNVSYCDMAAPFENSMLLFVQFSQCYFFLTLS